MTDALAPDLTIEKADYTSDRDGAALVALLDAYARDPMGGGERLDESVKERLAPALAAFPGAFTLIARDGDDAVGLANCFTGFSTFKARPIVNIHDIAVATAHRGRGIGKALMNAVEGEAIARGACKVTLEVLSGNEPAKSLYASLGYSAYSLRPETGTAQFWEKALD